MGSRDARINVGSFESSSEAAGRQTKCRTSAAEVPMYRFPSMSFQISKMAVVNRAREQPLIAYPSTRRR